jgi:hypothetical protein
MKLPHEAWVAALGRTEPTIQKFVKKRVTQLVAVQQLFEEGARLGFERVDARLHTHISESFSLGQTAIVEDGLHDLRAAESQHQPNTNMSTTRAWSANVQKDLLGNANLFEQTPWRHETIAADKPQCVPPQAFAGSTHRKNNSMDMHDIVSTFPAG